jgi:hypothetical protein
MDFKTTPTNKWIEWALEIHKSVPQSKYGLGAFALREWYTDNLAWAIPSRDAVSEIARFSAYNIVEIGAGSGFWSLLLSLAGAKVAAYDADEQPWPERFYGVKSIQKGQASEVAGRFGPRSTLFLCWPPSWNDMSYESIVSFGGNRLVYIGEGKDGCTGSYKFHEELERGWQERMPKNQIPCWPGIHDRVHFYERKSSL